MFGTLVTPDAVEEDCAHAPDTDAALAVGVTPVALSSYNYLEDGLGPWAMPLAEGTPEVLRGEPNFEHIASLRPDSSWR